MYTNVYTDTDRVSFEDFHVQILTNLVIKTYGGAFNWVV